MKRGEMHDCRNCGGDGYTIDSPTCPACDGEGRVPYTPLVRVTHNPSDTVTIVAKREA
jgi:DnaJ-class molecular chaperone